MQRKQFELQVRVHGRPVREYLHEGRVYIEGRKGTDFTLRIANPTDRRILAVPTVDGLSVMDGQEGSFDSGGYVIDPFGHMNIPGWRLDDDQVAQFFFSKQGASYASKMGKPLNVGVIACAIFLEKYVPSIILTSCYHVHTPYRGGESPNWTYTCDASNDISLSNTSGSVGEVSDRLEAQNLGTGFGKKQDHRVTTVTFERASETPEAVLELFYDDREGLQRRGVDLSKKPVVAVPKGFPAQKGCQPPAGWRG